MNSDIAECQSSASLQDHLNEQRWSQGTVVHQELTSGASPTIHLQSGEKASGPLHSRANTASPRLGTRCSICSSRTWKWSQSSGSMRSAEDSMYSEEIEQVNAFATVKHCSLPTVPVKYFWEASTELVHHKELLNSCLSTFHLRVETELSF